MVTFFFVMSGFVMMISHHHKPDIPILGYYIHRLARVMPVYLLALTYFVWINPDPLSLLLSLTFTQAWVSPYPLLPNVAGWSLSVEMFFYLLFPWLLYLVKRYHLKASMLLLLTSGIFGLTQMVLSRLIQPDIYPGEPSLIHDLIFFFPLSHLCSFLLGGAAGKLFLENTTFFNSRGLLQLLLFSTALTSVYLTLNNLDYINRLFTFPVVLGASFFAPLFALLVLGIASSDNKITRLFTRAAFVFLGEISFAIYILQFPVHLLLERIFPATLLAHNTLFFLGFLLILILVSAFIHRYFEVPCKRYLLKQYRATQVSTPILMTQKV